jgi:menaquinone-dependent protoporphyrinogen oxidase
VHVLVTYGTKMGGTAEIAKRIADTLGAENFSITLRPAKQAQHPEEFDAVVVGSALYALRWRREAVRVLKRLATAKFERPVWLFHSGPIGDQEAGDRQKFPARVEKQAELLDVRDRATFGGRLAEDARGFIARSMVKQGRAGDWRDFEEIDLWAKGIALDLGRLRS